jgi:hypothetical protein
VKSEKAILFGRSEALVGVLCSPAEQARLERTPIVVFLNAGIVHRVGPNRLYVNLARALADNGVESLRFDLGGIGDSLSAREHATMQELVLRDIRDAVDVASSQDPARGVVLIGLCSGADNAFQAAVQDSRVVGAVLIDPNTHRTRGFYVRHYLRAIFDRSMWRTLLTGQHPITARLTRFLRERGDIAAASVFLAPTSLPPKETVRNQLAGLLERNCGLLYVFTGGLPWRYNHGKQFARTYPDLASHSRLQTKYFGLSDHTFSNPLWQKQLVRTVVDWISAPTPTPTHQPRQSVVGAERTFGTRAAFW